MFTAKSVRSKLISSAPIDTAFLIMLPSFFPSSSSLQDEINIFCIDLLEIFLSHMPYRRHRCKTPPLTSWVTVCGRGCNVHLYVALYFNNSLLCNLLCKSFYCHMPPCCVRRCILGSDSCRDNGVDAAVICALSTKCRGILAIDSCCDNGV